MTTKRLGLFGLFYLSKLTKCQSTVPTAAVPQQTQAGVVVVLASEVIANLSWNPPQLFGSDVCGGGTGCAGSWWVQTAPQAKSGSIHGTVGQDTSVELSFNGTSVSVFGRTLNNGANGLASVDGESVIKFPTQSADGQVHEQQLLWSSPVLDGSVEHILKVAFDPTFFGATVNNRSWLQIDYFQYTFNPNATTSSLPSPSSTSLSNTPLFTSSSGSASSSSAPTTASLSSSAKHVPVGVIAGVTSGLVAIVAGIIAIFAYRRCKHRHKGSGLSYPSPWYSDTQNAAASQGTPVPFAMSSASSSVPISSGRSTFRLPTRGKVSHVPPRETSPSRSEVSRAPVASVSSPEAATLPPSTIASTDVVPPPAYSEST